MAAVAIGILAGVQLVDGGDPLVETSPTPAPTSTTAPPAAPSPTVSPTSPTPADEGGEDPSVEVVTVSSSEPAADGRPATEVDLDYPQVVGLADGDVQERVNRTIADEMQAAVEEFRDAASEPAQGDTPPYGIWSGVTVGVVDPTVVSTLVPITTYLGGAHPFTVVRTFTFDLTTGERLELTDLFEDGILERASELAVAAIEEEYATGDWAQEGAAPTNESLGRFVLAAEHLQIWFDNYQVGPYAIGTPSVDIPYTELDDLIPPEGIVARLAGG